MIGPADKKNFFSALNSPLNWVFTCSNLLGIHSAVCCHMPNNKAFFIFYFYFLICLPPEFLRVSGPTEGWCASTLGAALQCSSWAGSDSGYVSRWVEGFIITCWSRQYGFNLETLFSRDLETARFEPGAAGSQYAALPQSYHASVILRRYSVLYFYSNKLANQQVVTNCQYFNFRQRVFPLKVFFCFYFRCVFFFAQNNF